MIYCDRCSSFEIYLITVDLWDPLCDFQKCGEDRGTAFICSQPSCGHRMSSSEVSLRLQEIRVHLEKAVDLMEGERPGGCDAICTSSNICVCHLFKGHFLTSPCYSALPSIRWGSETVEEGPVSVWTDPRRDTPTTGGAGRCHGQSICYNGWA